MKVDQKGHTITIKETQADFTAFLMKVTHQYKSYEEHNLIIDLLPNKEVTIEDIKLLKPLSKQHKKAKKSFIIVADGIDFNAVSTKLTVVPTLLEANDIIGMEEIERDLGF
ncbi:ribonuclease Z [Flavobacterium sp. 7A]|uniref:ribonuclease Z n=1 Tax=Flavobacterium sp. 7A TaxID=2940571 RepID=UPI0022268C95|nr:ribonuclease Z [Flavobacterium sp. 7A]MCW2118468.1 putative AAA+ superfamily ATPase [Flavobacterium sp. 7A]